MIVTITGHTYTTREDYEKYYSPVIRHLLTSHHDVRFVLGTADGVDRMAYEDISDIVKLYGVANKSVPSWLDGVDVDLTASSYTERDDNLRGMADAVVGFVYKTKMGLGSGTARNIVAHSGMDVSDFYAKTRRDDATVDEILDMYPTLVNACMEPPCM